MKVFDVVEAKKGYAEGRNVTELLRAQQGVTHNTSEIIEIAYDLQAGTYIESTEKNAEFARLYSEELAAILQNHVRPSDTVLDVGTGELTTLSLLIRALKTPPGHLLAYDISWSRIYKGLEFAKQHMGPTFARFTPFVADIGQTPLLDKSVNVTISNHALEPNGGRLPELLTELFRITRDTLVLFEPCYEINSEEGRQRMDRLGYIKGVDAAVAALGGTLVEKIRIGNVNNPLNPTVGFVIRPRPERGVRPASTRAGAETIFSVPGTSHPLERVDDCYFSNTTGLCFPILKSIPVLKPGAAILASALTRA